MADDDDVTSNVTNEHPKRPDPTHPQVRRESPTVTNPSPPPPPPPPRPSNELYEELKQRVGKIVPLHQAGAHAEAGHLQWARQADSAADKAAKSAPDQAGPAETDAETQNVQRHEEMSQLVQMRQLAEMNLALSQKLRGQNRRLVEEHSVCACNAIGAFIGGVVVGMAVFMAVDRWPG